MKIKIILLLASFLTVLSANGTHLNATDLTYKYLGLDANQKPMYEITLTMYIECFLSDVPPDSFIELGIYQGFANNQLIETSELKLSKTSNYTDAVGCSKNICLLKADYVKNITLPDNQDYRIVYARCCRNIASNIKYGASGPDQGFYNTVTISGNSTNNSSCIINAPIWSLETNDTNYIDLEAYDPDGDSIVIQLVTPLHAASNSLVKPVYDFPNTYEQPKSVTMNTGFPPPYWLGFNGYVQKVGIASYKLKAPEGNYYLAFQIQEYRNGILISSRIADAYLYYRAPTDQLEIQPLQLYYADDLAVGLKWYYCERNKQTKVYKKISTASTYSLLTSFSGYQNTYTDYQNISRNTTYQYYVEVFNNSGQRVWSSDKESISFGGVGISELKQVIATYPNPSKDQLFIQSSKGIQSAELLDIRGQVVISKDLSSEVDYWISTGNLRTGVYHLQLRFKDGSISTQKVIKQD